MSLSPVNDEHARLGALRQLEIVGTPPTAAFDAIVKAAANVFTCPLVAISLLDESCQWFKAECGLGVSSTPREIAFCNYTLLGTDVFSVEDTRRDQRFVDNPLVTGPPFIRFYAGVSIAVESGHRIGALCVGDTRPRVFSDQDKERLQHFGKIVEHAVAAHYLAVRVGRKAELLRKKNRLLEQMERVGKIGAWELDIDANRVDWSDEVFRIHGLPVGGPRSLEEALSFYRDDQRSIIRRAIEAAIATGAGYSLELEFVTAPGHKKWVRTAGECQHQAGKPVKLFGMFQDITEEKAATERLWRAANFDEMTGLPNRHHFYTTLADAIHKAGKEAVGKALMILDLDNFKEINDTRGHAVGDDVLAAFGRRLGQTIGSEGYLARIGGDEFAVISDCCTSAQIESFGREILKCFEEPVCLATTQVFLNGSLGVARFPDDATTAGELMKYADLGLCSAKTGNRGSIGRYAPGLATAMERHAQAADLVRSGLISDSLVAFYQPKVRLDDGSLSGFEALARILSSDGSTIGPATFGVTFEDHEIARRIGERMLHRVTDDIASWRDAGLDPGSVSLNVSEADFADGMLAKRVLRRLDDLSLPPACLTIEVTEAVFLGEGTTRVREALADLDGAGVRIELDDFGTGYASLVHLRAFPISRLKIDQSFVQALDADNSSRAIVQAVIDLGHTLALEIIAEGVETQSQADVLRKMGCDLGQGYLFGRPVTAQQARSALLNGSGVAAAAPARDAFEAASAGKLAGSLL